MTKPMTKPTTYILTPHDEPETGRARETLSYAAPDLATLANLAARLSSDEPPGRWKIDTDDGRPWGILTLDGPGRWLLEANQGRTTIGPGFLIL